MYLPYAYERPGLLGLIAEGVDQLVYLQRKVAVRAYPDREHRIHRGLGGRAEQQANVQLVQAGMRDPIYLGVEALDVVLLLLEFRLGDEQGKAHLIMASGVQLLSYERVDLTHDLPAICGPDVHSLDRVAFIGQAGLLDQVIVPLTEVFFFPHVHHHGVERLSILSYSYLAMQNVGDLRRH